MTAEEASVWDALVFTLKKAAPAVLELHMQGIGCPDCYESEEEAPLDGPPRCGLVRGIEAVLLEAKQVETARSELIVQCRNTPGRCFCGVHRSDLMAEK